jgi:SAM-dependent methyltransferase
MEKVKFSVASAYGVPLPDESVDIVFGVAIVHHLDLLPAAQEVHRVLRRGWRAIFKEPVRNSRTLRVLRKLVPYRSADVSPFERPLTTREIQEFGAKFRPGYSGSFELPWLSRPKRIPGIKMWSQSMALFGQTMLKRYPFLQHYASVHVFELIKD